MSELFSRSSFGDLLGVVFFLHTYLCSYGSLGSGLLLEILDVHNALQRELV